MQGIVSGGILVAAFVAMAGLAVLVAARLYRISRPGQPGGQLGQPGGQLGEPSGQLGQPSGQLGEPPDA